MKIRNIIAISIMLFRLSLLAGFGGSRSSSSFSSGRSSFSSSSSFSSARISSGSSFGGSRSSSSVTISKPATIPKSNFSSSRPAEIPRNVVHEYHNHNSVGGLGGFWSGFWINQLMHTNNHPVVVTTGVNGQIQQPVAISDRGSSYIIFNIIGTIFIIGIIGFLIYIIFYHNKERK